VHAALYNLSDTFQGDSFLSGFTFFTQADPMQGRVRSVIFAHLFLADTLVGRCSNFVTQEGALSRGLAAVNGSSN